MSKATLTIFENYPLKHLNTFGIDVKAHFYCEVSSIEELSCLFSNEYFVNSKNILLLGGGSNILFTKDFDGMVIRVVIKGIRIYKEKSNQVFLSVAAGEVWHDFVKFCIENGLAGIENLSLIPGTVGAAPIQNIGAYGVELKDVVTGVDTVSLRNGNRRFIGKALLKFGYRDSIFKHEFKQRYLITAVHFRLNRIPSFNISYGAIQETLDKNGVKELSIKAISDAVVEIRQSKLPNPAEIGNAGSFFKNPTVSIEIVQKLKSQYPTIPSYPVDEENVKIAAGWLIEQCGWKGKRVGNTGIHVNQALVLVNYGNATGAEIVKLAYEIIDSVKEKFGITLTPEVNIV